MKCRRREGPIEVQERVRDQLKCRRGEEPIEVQERTNLGAGRDQLTCKNGPIGVQERINYNETVSVDSDQRSATAHGCGTQSVG